MRRCNQVMGIILLALSIWIIINSRELVYTVEFSPGAGFFPFWLGIALAVLSLLLLAYNTIFKLHETEGDPLPGKKGFLRIVSIMGGFLISILVFEHIGFLISMFFLMAFLLMFLEKYPWHTGIVISLVLVFFIYGIFKIWLNIPLPPGLFR